MFGRRLLKHVIRAARMWLTSRSARSTLLVTVAFEETTWKISRSSKLWVL
jgi:hypothetical protein